MRMKKGSLKNNIDGVGGCVRSASGFNSRSNPSSSPGTGDYFTHKNRRNFLRAKFLLVTRQLSAHLTG